jgi:hypothetical protein
MVYADKRDKISEKGALGPLECENNLASLFRKIKDLFFRIDLSSFREKEIEE